MLLLKPQHTGLCFYKMKTKHKDISVKLLSVTLQTGSPVCVCVCVYVNTSISSTGERKQEASFGRGDTVP